ncbi:MAG: hypothetical protein RR472_05675 [Anaerovoracaceae bacterium]
MAFVLQGSLLNLFSIVGGTPNLILCLTVAIAFIYEEGYKCIPIALITMLISDAFLGIYLGVGALSLFLTTVMVLIGRRSINTDHLFPTTVVGIVSVMVYNLIYWVILKILKDPMTILYYLEHQVISIVYSTIVIALAFLLMTRKIAMNKIDRYEE